MIFSAIFWRKPIFLVLSSGKWTLWIIVLHLGDNVVIMKGFIVLSVGVDMGFHERLFLLSLIGRLTWFVMKRYFQILF
jgi:hypothetical protein